MSSEAVAYGEGPPLVEPADVDDGGIDRGKDWPLVVAVFVPVLAAYGAIGYGVFVVATMLA